MSTDTTNLELKISLLKKLIGLYQQLLLLKSKKAVCIIHWTATSRDLTSFEAINRGHAHYPKSKLGHNIAYNYLIGGNYMKQARMDTESGLACYAYKGREIDICFTGMEGEKMTDYQKEYGEFLIDELRRDGRITGKIRPHSYFSNTECCGDEIRAWIDEVNKGPIK